MSREIVLFQPGGKIEKATLPMSLLPIAATILKVGYKVKILDERIENYQQYDFSNTFAIGITALTGSQITQTTRFAKYIRENYPQIILIWGGVHASLMPKQTAESELVDIVVKGEGEETIVDLLKALIEQEPLNNIAGIVFKQNGVVIETENRKFMDLNTIPDLPWHLLKLEKYLCEPMPIQTSRGCPYNCTFCFNRAYNKLSWRCKSPETVIKDMKYTKSIFGGNFFHFYDDNFFVSEKRAIEIAQKMIKELPGIEWSGLCRAEYLAKWSNETFLLLKKSGLKRLSIGGESGSDRVLALINKGATREINLTAIKKCKEFNITAIISYMCGFPGETKKEVEETMDFMDLMVKTYSGARGNALMVATPYPGTQLYEQAVALGFYQPQKLEEWNENLFGFAEKNPWYTKEYAHWLQTISNVSFLLYDNPAKFSFEPKQLKRFILKGILLISARVRWKTRFFAFPIEWDVYKKMAMKGQ